MTSEEASRLCPPEIAAQLRQAAQDAGPLSDAQARLIARVFGNKPEDSRRRTSDAA